MQRPLLIIDLQRGYLSEYNRFLPGGIASLVKAELFNPIIFTRYINTPDSPARLFLEDDSMSGFGDAGMAPQIKEVMGASVPGLEEYGVTNLGEGFGADRYLVTTNLYTCVTPEFEELLSELELDNSGLYIVGCDTEAAVLKTSLDLFERGIEPIILAEFCGSHRGLGFHERALGLLKELIGEERVVADYMPMRQRWERQKG